MTQTVLKRRLKYIFFIYDTGTDPADEELPRCYESVVATDPATSMEYPYTKC